MNNRREVDRLNATDTFPARRDKIRHKAASVYGAKTNFVASPDRTPLTIFGLPASSNPIGAVSASVVEGKRRPGPSAPQNVRNPFQHHVSERKHHSLAANYIPPTKRHLLREYLKRSSIRFYNQGEELRLTQWHLRT